MKEKVLSPRISLTSQAEYISLKAMDTPITWTITVCQVTDYSTKITYCLQTVPSSSQKAPFTNLFCFP